MQLTQDQLVNLLRVTLGAFREEISSDITAARILTLLEVVRTPGVQQADLGQLIGDLSQAAVSRNVLDWTDHNSARKPGPDFLAQRPDPNFRKRNLVYPTTKGLSFLNRLTDTTNKRLARAESR